VAEIHKVKAKQAVSLSGSGSLAEIFAHGPAYSKPNLSSSLANGIHPLLPRRSIVVYCILTDLFIGGVVHSHSSSLSSSAPGTTAQHSSPAADEAAFGADSIASMATALAISTPIVNSQYVIFIRLAMPFVDTSFKTSARSGE